MPSRDHDPSPPPGGALREAAHHYAETGWPVFPCRPGGKAPATTHGHLDATTSHAQIDRWWARTPRANVAIACGHPGPDVLDIDIRPGRSGFTALRQATRAGLVPVPADIVRTPSGGAHLYFPGTAQHCGALPACALDFRAHGGAVIAPPSWSASHRRRYRLLSTRPGVNPLDWAALRRLLQPLPPPADSPWPEPASDAGLVNRLAAWLETRPPGNRNYPLYWAAKFTTAAGLMDSNAREQLIATSLRSGLRGGEREARRTVASGERAGARSQPPAGHASRPPQAR
jgi:Bifunctional DNA primase/polymerase, N-terminal